MTSQPVEPVDVLAGVRQYVSQYATDLLGLMVYVQGVAADVDDPPGMTVTLIKEDDGSQVFSRPATRVDVGVYEIALQPSDSDVPGNYTARWTYVISGSPRVDDTYIQVGKSDPAYDALSTDMKQIVDTTWMRFADGFDSPDGGPNLQTYFQTNFSRGRVAQLLRVAVGTLNTASQPYQTYSLDPSANPFPVMKWGSLLERALYVEVLKHLVRSYVEQPMFVGGSVTRLDRRDYMDRWRMVLSDEQALLNQQLEVFKISNMGLGKPAVLVSGGVYGRYGPTRLAGNAAARPRFWARWY